MLRALPTTEGALDSSPENFGSRTDFGFQVAYAVAAGGRQQGQGEAAGGQGAARAAVDGEAERGGAGDDGDAGAHGQVEGAVRDVRGDLVLEAGEPLGVVDQGLGADRVELVDVDVEADGARVAVAAPGRRAGRR